MTGRALLTYDEIRTVTHERCNHFFPRLRGWCGKPSTWAVYVYVGVATGACDEHLSSVVEFHAEDRNRPVTVHPYWLFTEQLHRPTQEVPA